MHTHRASVVVDDDVGHVCLPLVALGDAIHVVARAAADLLLGIGMRLRRKEQ